MSPVSPPQEPRRAAAVPAPRHQRPVLGPPLFDLPELAEPFEAFTAEIVRRLEPWGVARAACTRSVAPVWSRLLFGQIGAYRYVKRLSDLVQPIGTPRYAAEGAEGVFLRSAVLVRQSAPWSGVADLRGRTLALSERDLDSANLLRAEAALLAQGAPFFASVVRLPSLDAPAAAVAAGRADAALVDGVGYALLQRHRPALTRGLRVLLWTSRSLAPPFVAAMDLGPGLAAGLAGALVEVVRDPALKPICDALLIRGVQRVAPAEHRAVLHFEQIAETLGYPELR